MVDNSPPSMFCFARTIFFGGSNVGVASNDVKNETLMMTKVENLMEVITLPTN